MPIGALQPDTSTPDDFDQAAAALPLPQSERTAQAFGNFDFSQQAGHLAASVFGGTPGVPALTQHPLIDTDTVNQKYGVEGYLRFNKPTDEDSAAFDQHMALQRQYRDMVFARTNAQPLTDFAAGLAGTLFDPAALSTMAMTDGIGDAALGVAGLGRVAEAAPAITTLGRIANVARVPLEGAVNNIPFVGINAGLSNAYGDEYDMGDALRDITAGAVLHTTTHFAFRALPAMFRRGGVAMEDAPADANAPPPPPPLENALEPNPAPAGGVPPEVDALPEQARRGAWLKAIDDASNDRPVDVAQYVGRELDTQADSPVPPLRPWEGSWIVRDRETGDHVAERYDPAQVAALNTDKYEAVPAGQALAEFNARVKSGEPFTPTAPARPALDLAANPDTVLDDSRPRNEAQRILAEANRRFAAGDAGNLDELRPPGRPDAGPDGSAAPAAADVRVPEGQGEPRSGPGAQGGEPGAGDGEARAAKIDTRALIAADPELRAMAEDTARLAAENNLAEPATPENQNPDTLAEALRAAATCLIGELG